MTARLDTAIARMGEVILGKEHQLRLALPCLLARGHLLIEDLPAVGKANLAHALATVPGLHYQRIQFTSDLLPADILGVSIYNRDTADFKFHPGPVFSHIVLADEINRATPKAQSALPGGAGVLNKTSPVNAASLPVRTRAWLLVAVGLIVLPVLKLLVLCARRDARLVTNSCPSTKPNPVWSGPMAPVIMGSQLTQRIHLGPGYMGKAALCFFAATRL